MFRLDPNTSANSSARQTGKRRLGRVLQILTLTSLSIVAAACGGDDSDETPAQTSGGKGGASGSAAGSGGSAGNAPLMPPPPVPCGSVMCPAPSSALTGIANMFGGAALAGLLPRPVGCCLDEAEGKCGLAMMDGAMCEAPAVPDKRCPAANLGMLGPLLGANSMSGCCIDNKCGQDGRIFGRGCVDNAAAAQMLNGLPLGAIGGGGMMMSAFPPAQACDAPVMTPNDADGGVADLDAGI